MTATPTQICKLNIKWRSDNRITSFAFPVAWYGTWEQTQWSYFM